MIVASETSVAEMVTLALPGLPESGLDRVRVSIGEHVIGREAWRHVRPKPGASVIIRAVPGDDTLRYILTVAVIVSAIALGQFYAPAIAGAIGVPFTATAGTLSIISSVATAGFAVAGSLLVNALIPVRGLGDKEREQTSLPLRGCRIAAIREVLFRPFWGSIDMPLSMPPRHTPRSLATISTSSQRSCLVPARYRFRTTDSATPLLRNIPMSRWRFGKGTLKTLLHPVAFRTAGDAPHGAGRD
jgi:hypothetical protein